MKYRNFSTYFIDTELDEDDNTYDEKSQETIDIMIEQMKLDIKIFNSIDTKNFDVTGENCKLRKENEKKQIEELLKKLEEEKIKIEKEEEEKKRLQEEIQKMKEDNEIKKKKEEELKEILKKQEEDRKKYEEREKKFQEEQRKIEEEAKNRNIEIESLDGKINENLLTAKKMAKSGLATAGGTFAFMMTLESMEVPIIAGSIADYATAGIFFGGAVWFVLAGVPLVFAGANGIKKLIKKQINKNLNKL